MAPDNNKDGERLAVVEEQVKQLVTAVTGLSQDLRSWQQNYVPRQEIGEMFRARDKEIQDINDEMDKLRNEKSSGKAVVAAWAGVIVSGLAVAVAIIAILAN